MIITNTGRRGQSWAAWLGPSHAGGLVLTLDGTDGDDPLFRTIVATILGPYPFGSAPPPTFRDSTCGVALLLDAMDEEVPASHGAVYPSSILIARIENRSDGVVTFVRPGDGSGEGVRTPFVKLKYRRAREVPSLLGSHRICPNEPPLAGDVLILRPGEACILSSRFFGPGLRPRRAFRVRTIYESVPSMPWQSVVETPAPNVAELIRSSTPCRMRSNEVAIRLPRQARRVAPPRHLGFR